MFTIILIIIFKYIFKSLIFKYIPIDTLANNKNNPYTIENSAK